MMLEQLEARTFLSVTAQTHGTDLLVRGTRNPNNITLEFSRSSVDGDLLATVRSNRKIIWGLARGNNAMIPFPKRFILEGGDGADHLTASGEFNSHGQVIIRGGSGNDQIKLISDQGFPARIYGDQGNDIITISGPPTPAPNVFMSSQWRHLVNIHGNAGDDQIQCYISYQDRHAPRGDVRLFGDAGNDEIIGGDASDRLEGGDGNDTLYGDIGNDLLIGGSGDDALYGEAGSDLLIGSAGDHHIVGGLGDDVIHQGSPPSSLRM